MQLSGGKDKNFDIERSKAFDYILEIIDEQKKIAGAPPLILSVTDLDPAKAKKTAAAEAWKLIEQGVLHLKDGGPAGTPGLFHAALSRMSLRASPLAQAIGVKNLPFENENTAVIYADGFSAAFTPVQRLLRAALHDSRDSKRVIAEALERADSLQLGFFLTPDQRVGVMTVETMTRMLEKLKHEPTQADTFNALSEKNNGPTEERELMEKHQKVLLQSLASEYQTACNLLNDRLQMMLGKKGPLPRPPQGLGQ